MPTYADFWTEARAASIVALRQEGLTSRQMVVHLNQLPGPALSLTQVRGYLEKHAIVLSDDAKRRLQAEGAEMGRQRRSARLAQGRSDGRVPAPGAPARYTASARMPWRCEMPAGPVELPPPGPDGRVEALLGELIVWTRQNDIEGFDGSNVPALNRLLTARKLPPVVVVDRR